MQCLLFMVNIIIHIDEFVEIGMYKLSDIKLYIKGLFACKEKE